ncbi:MAG TPA: hypothetical protein VOA41_10645 [Candidatus Dormibacteraeota bacterium]|nr:hypothetical protein [Candidatus Dormibacteraeota bacterium]
MLTLPDYVFFLGEIPVPLFVVCLCIKRNVFRQFAALNFYFLSLAVVTAGRFYVFEKYGSGSHEYVYFYYYGDSVLTLTLYGAVSSLAQEFLAPFLGRRRVRFAVLGFLGLMACFSYVVVRHAGDRAGTLFVVELGYNLYFFSAGLALLLWLAASFPFARDRILGRLSSEKKLLSVLGVYFGVFLLQLLACTYSADLSAGQGVLSMNGIVLSIGSGFVFADASSKNHATNS